MKILFDQGVPAPLRRFLPGHMVVTAYEQGWSTLQNGELIRAAEFAEFEALVTTDRNLKYQQNLRDRRIAIFVLMSTSWPKIQKRTDAILSGISGLLPGDYVEFPIDPA